MKRPFLFCLLACACSKAPDFPAGRWVDLTHDFGPETIYWPTADGFKLRVDFKGITPKGYFYASNSYSASEHGGTHLDAPIHFAQDRMTADRIPIEQLIGPAAGRLHTHPSR